MGRRGALGMGIALTGLGAFADLCGSEAATAASLQEKTKNSPSDTCFAPRGKLVAHRGNINAMSITSDGSVLASGSDDHTVKLWSLPGGKLLTTLDGHMAPVLAITITPDGRILASGSDDNTIKLWSLPGGKVVATLQGHKSRIWLLAITPDGKILASGSDDHTVKLWSIPGGELLATLDGHTNSISALSISPDGKTLATGGEDNLIKLWSLPDGKLLATLEGHTDSVWTVAVSPDGKTLASGSEDKTVKLWSIPDGKLLVTLVGHLDAVRAIVFAVDGSALASASKDHTVRIWSLPDGNLHMTFEGHTGPIWTLAMTQDGKVLASASDDTTVKLWSAPDGHLLATLTGHTKEVGALVIGPGKKVLASGSNDHTAVIWDLQLALSGGNCFRSYLFDPADADPDVKGITYNVYDSVTRQTVTYTLPCGSPIPAGAICTCNCVPGRYEVPKPIPPTNHVGGGYSGGSGGCYTVGTVCQCNKICTCIPVPSSRRWKDNVQPLGGALDQAMQLRGVRFDWTADAPHNPSRRSDIGLIAEEVAQVVPEVVSLDEQGAPRAVDYGRLTALLVEALKAQQSQIQQLRREVLSLKAAQLPTSEEKS